MKNTITIKAKIERTSIAAWVEKVSSGKKEYYLKPRTSKELKKDYYNGRRS